MTVESWCALCSTQIAAARAESLFRPDKWSRVAEPLSLALHTRESERVPCALNLHNAKLTTMQLST